MESQDLEVEQRCSFISDRESSHPSEEFDLNNDYSNLETGVDENNEECLDSRVLFPMEHIDLMQESSAISNGDDDLQDSTVTDPLDIGTGNEDPLQNLTCSVMNEFDDLEKNDIKNKSTNKIETGDRCSTGIESHDYFYKQNSEGGNNLNRIPDRVDSSNGNSNNETGFSGKDNECLVLMPMEHIELTQEINSSKNMDDQTNQSKNDVNLESIATDPLDIGPTRNEDRLQKLTCWVCSKTFCHPSTLRLHMLRHTGAEPYSCTFCPKKFPVLRGLENHLVIHTGEKPFSCRICKESFTHYSTLQSHLMRHSGPSKYPSCVVCKVKFSHHSSLRRHMKTHPGETPYPCTLCSKKFSWHTHLKRHMLTHEDYIKKKTTCSVCSRTFASPNTLKIHERTHTGEKLFQCKLCLTSFTTNFTYKEHLLIHIGEKSFSCIYCPKSFITKNRLLKHTRTAHTCPNCGEIFTQRSLLRSHILTHKLRKQVSEDSRESIENSQSNTLESRIQLSCTVCAKRFIHSSSLESHMASMHTGGSPFSCTVCAKRFIHSSSLESHMAMHSGGSPFSCTVCAKRFIHSSSLESHMAAMHTGGSPFSCTVCAKRFIHSSSLESHMAMHTGGSPFSCTVCAKRFIHSSSLESHMAMHTGGRPFSCTVCNQRFVSSKTLERHTNRKICQYRVPCSVCHRFVFPAVLKNHMEAHDKKILSCTICGKKYTSSQGLNCHMEIHTNNDSKGVNSCNNIVKHTHKSLEKVVVIRSDSMQMDNNLGKVSCNNMLGVNNCNNMVKHTHKSLEKVAVIRNNSMQTDKDLEKLKKIDEEVKNSSENNNILIQANEEKASNIIILTESSKTVKKQLIINIMTEDKVEYIIDNPISCEICMNSRVIKHLVST